MQKLSAPELGGLTIDSWVSNLTDKKVGVVKHSPEPESE